jgi:uncharacterized RDD family membrane protein YckC
MENNPYAAPSAVVEDLYVYNADDLEARKASRWQRLGAALLDFLFYLLCVMPVIVAIGSGAYWGYLARAQGRPVTAPSATSGILLSVGVIAFFGLFIYNLVLLHRDGQTLGKRLMGIKIVRTDGDRATLGRIFFARMVAISVLGYIPYLGMVIRLIDICMIFGAERRCLHDLIADTIVIEA